jgi:hypothetical protein
LLAGAEGIIQHKRIEGDPGERFAEDKHHRIEKSMVRVVLDQHEEDLIQMFQPFYQGHTALFGKLKLPE